MSDNETRDHAADLLRQWQGHPRLRERHHGPRLRLVWTKCDMDVPDDQSFTVEGKAPAIICPECLAAIG
jgi:hypothetical protein